MTELPLREPTFLILTALAAGPQHEEAAELPQQLAERAESGSMMTRAASAYRDRTSSRRSALAWSAMTITPHA